MYRFRSSVFAPLAGALLVLAVSAPAQSPDHPLNPDPPPTTNDEQPESAAIDDLGPFRCLEYNLDYDYEGWIELEHFLPEGQWNFEPNDPVQVVEHDNVRPPQKVLLSIDMKRYVEARIVVEYSGDPNGWATNLGDSDSNNGCCGDAATSTFDAETWVVQPPAEGHNPPWFDYDVGVCTNNFGDGRHDLDGFLSPGQPTELNFVVRDQYLAISRNDPTPRGVVFMGPGMFRIDESLWDDEADACNDGLLWLGLNRVVGGTYRYGQGVLRAQITLTGKRPPSQVMPDLETGELLPIGLG